jgi:hypothetical protein
VKESAETGFMRTNDSPFSRDESTGDSYVDNSYDHQGFSVCVFIRAIVHACAFSKHDYVNVSSSAGKHQTEIQFFFLQTPLLLAHLNHVLHQLKAS